MTVTYHLKPADMRAFLAYNRWHSPQYRRLYVVIVGVVALLGVHHAFAISHDPHQRLVSFGIYFVTFLIVFPIVTFLLRIVLRFRSWTPEKQPGLICEHTLTLTDDALVETTPVGEGRHLWSIVRKVVETPRHIFLYVAVNAAHIIPKHAFREPAEAVAFLERVQQLRTRSQGSI